MNCPLLCRANVQRCSFYFLTSLASCVSVTTTWAADVPQDDGSPNVPIVVTATRAETALSSVGESVTVITPEEARSSQKVVLSDLLSTTPGVTVTRNGGIGGTTSVNIRGAESDQTVLMLDGVKLNDPSSAGGGYNFANLLVNDNARVEVLRGSQSTLWGSQAIGGVVNVITAEPRGPLKSTAAFDAGSFGTSQARLNAEAGSERFGWRVGANYLTTEGVSAFATGTEADGYRNTGMNARGIFHISEAVQAEVRSSYSRGRNDFDGFPPPTYVFADTPEYGKTVDWVNYAGVKIDALAGRLQQRVGVAYTDTDRQNFDPSSSVPLTFDASGQNLRYEYQGTLKLNSWFQSVFGLERERSEMSTSSPSQFDPDPRPLRKSVGLDSAYTEFQISPITTLTFSAGVRYDDHETFGGHTSSQAAMAWAVRSGTVIRASYGQGFKAPTLYQLYSEYGNEELDPEKSDDWDVGIEQHFGDVLTISATHFERDTEDMINFVSCFGATAPMCGTRPFGYYENLQSTHAAGYEFSLNARFFQRVRFNANYTTLNTRNESHSSRYFGNELPRRPSESASAELTYEWQIPLTATLAAQYVGRSYDDSANSFALDDYTLVDVRASYDWSQHLQIYGRLENALDEKYQTIQRYGTVGRGLYFGFRVSM